VKAANQRKTRQRKILTARLQHRLETHREIRERNQSLTHPSSSSISQFRFLLPTFCPYCACFFIFSANSSDNLAIISSCCLLKNAVISSIFGPLPSVHTGVVAAFPLPLALPVPLYPCPSPCPSTSLDSSPSSINENPAFDLPAACRACLKASVVSPVRNGCSNNRKQFGRFLGSPPWSQFKTQISALYHIGSTNDAPELPDDLSEDCQDFILWCLERDPRKRPNCLRLLEHPFLTGESTEAFKQARHAAGKASTGFSLIEEGDESSDGEGQGQGHGYRGTGSARGSGNAATPLWTEGKGPKMEEITAFLRRQHDEMMARLSEEFALKMKKQAQ